MQSRRLGLGILTTLAATMLACDSPTSASNVVAPERPSFARGGRPGNQTTTARIAISPSTYQMVVGGNGWLHVTLYDKNGNVVPDNDGSLLWYGCKPADETLPSCLGYLSVVPVYPNLRDVNLGAAAPGTFTVWVDDGKGNRAQTIVTVQ